MTSYLARSVTFPSANQYAEIGELVRSVVAVFAVFLKTTCCLCPSDDSLQVGIAIELYRL